MEKIIAPSILSADFMHLYDEINGVYKKGARWVHVDIMDGRFVNNFTFGNLIVEWIRKYFKDIFIDAHLMVEYPETFIDYFKKNVDAYTFHIEAKRKVNVKYIIQKIRSFGIKPGIAIKPKTPLVLVKKYIKDIDILLIMSVEPGFGGQKFLTSSIKKIIEARKYIDTKNLKTIISVDGGINDKSGKLCLKAGANVLVAGSYVFEKNSYTKLLKIIGGAYVENQITKSG
ncbi:MAG: ribulose-phosphate 3-epimerase [bacterium]|nr:ribulose-phosphate 3-epimerase [bacterium]